MWSWGHCYDFYKGIRQRYHEKENMDCLGHHFGSLVIAAWYFRPVGTVEGPEWDILHVDGITYISERSAGFDIPYDRSDRGMHIGIIKSGDYIFHIYEVKGDPDRNYLYWAWEWEGDMYVRQDIAEAMKKQEG